jgi:hypothetical protein
MTVLERRLAKVEEALSPTEAVVRWLEEAKSDGTFAAYSDRLVEHPAENPFTTIPRLAAAWARQEVGQREDPAAREWIERAVRSALVRFELVEWLNRTLVNGAQGDANQLGLVRLLAPFVLTGRADALTEHEWVNHAGRLVDEARLWHESAQILGERYLAGHSPLFPDVEQYLTELQADCESLLHEYNRAAARPKGRKPKGGGVDLVPIDAHVAELLEAHIEGIVRIVRTETEVHLGERERTLAIEKLVGRDA